MWLIWSVKTELDLGLGGAEMRACGRRMEITGFHSLSDVRTRLGIQPARELSLILKFVSRAFLAPFSFASFDEVLVLFISSAHLHGWLGIISKGAMLCCILFACCALYAVSVGQSLNTSNTSSSIVILCVPVCSVLCAGPGNKKTVKRRLLAVAQTKDIVTEYTMIP